jgi:zinc/manganese transport system permease protein
VAVIAGVTGFFAVLRGQTFAAHAIPNGAFAGAAGATLLGLNPFLGLAGFSVAGALGIAGLSRRSRPDVATALTFVMMLGVGALFVSWSTEYAQEAYSLLFGEVFGVSQDEVLPIVILGGLSIVAIILMFRPLMLTSALPEVAEARGVSTRAMELAFLLIMALATSMTVPVVGALLMFSLMIGPAAAARSLTARPGLAIVLSVAIALVTVWVGIIVSYQTDWPLGFFVGVMGAAFFLLGRGYAAARQHLAARAPRPRVA